MNTCQICQHVNPDGAEYCEDCGASLATPAPDQGAATSQSTPGASGAAPAAASAATGAAAPPAGGSEPVSTPPGETDPNASAPATGVGEILEAMSPSDTDLAETPEAPAVEGSAAAEPAPPAAEGGAPAPTTPPTEPPAPATPSGSATGQNPRLIAQRHGAAAGNEYPLLGERLVVGRFDAETGPVDIDLSGTPEAAQLSRHHAEVYREADGRWYVKDLGSTNGVWVKSAGSATFGPRLTTPRALVSGDEVAFGNARFIFRLD